ncbi:TPA: phage tail tape measure protein [Pasteurella multocida]|uniref:phage tail tape measure protein n=2 Tax=Pasteurella multocida TaxID=747 RepID=UPI002BCC4852|nr:phage tail tape measure protein [Pasteurella multocida]MEB3468501.1 phage tail tape measure protein [Pasteurella multocida]MEB3499585.1 phage tail tape measure protein [Pasteurella multocida]HDR1813442.1 phage tail tape measure protein [Pasteurella multocida]HDR1906842.1 phage tail tape measure protein [Pasteurella multocida]
MLLNELLIKIGVKTNEKDLNKLKETDSLLGKLPIAAGLIGAAFTGAVAGLTAFANAQLTALDNIHHLSRVTGEAVDKIYQLGKVAELNGSSSEAAQSSIKGLSKAIGEAAVGVGRGAKAFEDYGLSAKDAEGNVKDSLTVMGELSEKMQSMSEQEQIAMLSKLGIDESMIQTLRLGKQELAELMAERDKMTLGVGTKENAQIAADFKDSLTDLSQMIKAVGEYLSLKFAPAIQRMIERFKNWFVVNNDLIKKGLSILGDSLAWIIDFFTRTIGIIDDLVSSTIGWENAIYLVGAALIWLSRKMLIVFATNPIMWVIAAITGLFLLVDDFLSFLRGEESLFGEFWGKCVAGIKWANKKWKELLDWFDSSTLEEKFKAYFDVITFPFKAGFTLIKTLWDLLMGKDITMDGVKNTFDGATDFIKAPFKAAFDWIKEQYNKYIQPIINGAKAIGDFFTGGDSENNNVMSNTSSYDMLGVDPSGQFSSLPKNAISNTSADNRMTNSNNKITQHFTINGSGDLVKDISKVTLDATNAVLNTKTSVVM